ncbi:MULTISPECIES: hypothetical protein [Agrobacterium]|uniref:hypothetical protein n=1 Tax=Agrobacterium TaxID=357 RepID=UPI002300A7DF|nr:MULTISPECIES: hypothetical protein [Agrobacterium]MDA5630772.1 hypothetical protein [Agrobacterium sp. ST15.16.055]MDA6982385.1 hypothetical protein [Agrobacterium salinitolerans]
MEVIIDTNVAMVANHQNDDVQQTCQDACTFFLTDVKNNHIVLMDSGDEIRSEYAGALQQSRPYQLGAQFLIHLYQNQWNPKRVRIVDLAKTPAGEFADFPTATDLANFDPSDRKFAAMSRNTGVAVTNAIDSDWADSLVALNANGIAVNFLCGCDKSSWLHDNDS